MVKRQNNEYVASFLISTFWKEASEIGFNEEEKENYANTLFSLEKTTEEQELNLTFHLARVRNDL